MAVPLPWAGLGALGEPAGDCLHKSKRSWTKSSSYLAAPMFGVRSERNVSFVFREGVSLLLRLWHHPQNLVEQCNSWFCIAQWAQLYQKPRTVWSGSMQTHSKLAASTFTGCCSKASKCQLKEMLCKGAQKRQNWQWQHWTHSSRSISCPRVALTWLLPYVFFSTEFRQNIWVSPRGGTVNSLQVTLSTHNFHYLYLLSSDEHFF